MHGLKIDVHYPGEGALLMKNDIILFTRELYIMSCLLKVQKFAHH